MIVRKVFLSVLGLIWLAPVYLLVANAIQPAATFTATNLWNFPTSFGFIDNVTTAWQQAGLGGSLGSTLLYSVLSPAIALVIGALAGFSIVALRLRHGFAWFMLIFGGTIFPSQMLLMPLFIGYADANLYDTRIGMVVIYTAISVPLAAFIMRNFFTGIPRAMYEAATIDGASNWRIFWRIYLPLSVSALAAIFILEFTFIWNDLLFGLTLTQSAALRPVMTTLASLQSAYAGTTIPVVLASGLLVSLPTIVLFLATQRLFGRGLALSQA